MTIGWIYLFIAIFFETAMILTMKTTAGFKDVTSGSLIILFISLTLFFESLAIKYIDLTMSYAVWVGFGLVVITLIDYMFFETKINLIGAISIVCIIFFMLLLSFKGIDNA